MIKKKEIIFDIKNIEKVLNEFFFLLRDKKFFLFSGEMGAGKTTLIGKIIEKILKSKSDFFSPTYSYMNEYLTEKNEKIYHFDLYRLKNLKEIEDLGLLEFIEKDSNYIFVEWPEILINSNEFKLKNYVYCKIEYFSIKKRKIIIFN